MSRPDYAGSHDAENAKPPIPEEPLSPPPKKKEDPLGLWIAIGLAIGSGLGIAMGNLSVGIAIGLVLGVAVGTAQQHKSQ